MNQRWLPLLLIALSCVTFGLALCTPLFSIHPMAGEWTDWVALFSPADMESRTYTLPGTLMELWREGECFLALLLACLSLVLPVVKLCVLWWEAMDARPINPLILAVSRASARYAMVEVFLVALMVLIAKDMPGGSHVELHIGTWFFAASVLLSLVASQMRPGIPRSADK